MDDQRLIVIGLCIVIALGVAFALFAPQAPAPTLDGAVAELKRACVAACSNDGSASVHVRTPAGAQLYTTDEAVCARLGDRLSCGRCPCRVEPGNASISPDGEYACAFTTGENGTRMACDVTVRQ
jgi:Na+-transporting NADH:ubiquinone oxidoreductase subunit NqrF